MLSLPTLQDRAAGERRSVPLHLDRNALPTREPDGEMLRISTGLLFLHGILLADPSLQRSVHDEVRIATDR